MAASAKGQFKRQVSLWAKELDVPLQSLAVRPMRTKWASWSTAGNLTFNSQLLELEPDLQRLVIVHELLHYSIPNHGKLWKSLMRVHLGPWEDLNARLKQAASENFEIVDKETG
jgi:predicted metal-dependent hydrolase